MHGADHSRVEDARRLIERHRRGAPDLSAADAEAARAFLRAVE